MLQPLPVPTAASATGRQQTSANERPHGPEHIQDYCSQHTCDYRTDFNARMVANRKLRRQESCQQVLPLQLAHAVIISIRVRFTSEVIAKDCT